VTHPRKLNPRQQYRLKQRDLIEASPLIAEKFPQLKALKLSLEYYDAAATTKTAELKCTLNLGHARSALWYACHCLDCIGGDFDLSQPLANAVAGRRKQATGDLRCAGTRIRDGRGERVACQTLLRYKLNLNYD
jgi:hypothetical protein